MDKGASDTGVVRLAEDHGLRCNRGAENNRALRDRHLVQSGVDSGTARWRRGSCMPEECGDWCFRALPVSRRTA